MGELPNLYEAQLEVNTFNEGESSDVNGLKIQMYTNPGNSYSPSTNAWGPNLGDKAFYSVRNILDNQVGNPSQEVFKIDLL